MAFGNAAEGKEILLNWNQTNFEQGNDFAL